MDCRELPDARRVALIAFLWLQAVPETVAQLSVTASVGYGPKQLLVGVFEQRATWFQAGSQCRRHGYDSLLSSHTYFATMNILAEVLSTEHSGGNVSVWSGYYSPYTQYPSLTTWYNQHCTEEALTLTGANQWNEQCIANHFTTYDVTAETQARRCDEQLPYVCVKSYDNLVGMTEYSDRTWTQLPPGAYSLYRQYAAMAECNATCMAYGNCLAATYFSLNQSCVLLMANKNVGHLTYTINDVAGQSATHFVRNGYNRGLYHGLAETLSLGVLNETFPVCNYTCHCPCYQPLNDTELQQIVEELVANLTIDRKKTSKTLRKLSSAKDERVSSTIAGSLGIALLTSVFVLLAVVDFPTVAVQIKTIFDRMPICKTD